MTTHRSDPALCLWAYSPKWQAKLREFGVTAPVTIYFVPEIKRLDQSACIVGLARWDDKEERYEILLAPNRNDNGLKTFCHELGHLIGGHVVGSPNAKSESILFFAARHEAHEREADELGKIFYDELSSGEE